MKKILVIEDTESIRNEIIEILNFEGFKTLGAENGQVGIQLARQHLPDLIICDVMMPGLNGYDVLAKLRQDSNTALIPFIFLTAKASKEDMRQGMNIGADDYLTKPFTADELLATVKARMERQTTVTQHYTSEIARVERQLTHFIDWSERQLNQLTYYNNLTGLPNQLLLQEQLNQAIQENRSGRLIAVLILHLDRFRNITYALGQEGGDFLLKTVAEELIGCVPQGDRVFHLGEDKFAILLPDLAQGQDATLVAQKLLQGIKTPVVYQGHVLHITASIGISLYPTDSANGKTLVVNADVAMQYAKEQGRNNYQFYSPVMTTSALDNLTLESKLNHALERGEFMLYYQPQVDLKTGQIVGVEALVRWQHPELGLVSPVKFIPLAEETGLIVSLGEWVIRAACVQNKSWQDAGFPPFCVAVNVSGRELQQTNLAETVTRILEDTRLEPRYLELELTESVVMKNVVATVAKLYDLTRTGITISLDDFGTGYSSLAYLRNLPIHKLKIDQSFVRNLTIDPNDEAIVTAIITMANSLGIKVVAEGVETENQVLFLHTQDCDGIQGYYFSKPVPAEGIIKLLQEKRRLVVRDDL